MRLAALLHERERLGEPVRVGLVGAGKFGTMYLAQARRTPGVHVLGVADLSRKRARDALTCAGWAPDRCKASSFREALDAGTTHVTDEAERLIAAPGLEVVIDATGSPGAAIRHALLAAEHRRHMVMATVEADALAGPLLALRAAEAGTIYSLAYGDQPALVCELVDWARTSGFPVVCAGKGTKYLPGYHASTPDTVWGHYGLSPARAAAGGLNPRMFNSFLDGTKSAIEMAAVANATGLAPPEDGLCFPPAGAGELAERLCPRDAGGVLETAGMVEVVSSLERDGRPVADDLRWGVFVTFEAGSDYVADCFSEYGLGTDRSGRYACLYRPFHLIGLELGVSVASVAVRGEATGAPEAWRADVVAVAKRDLRSGEQLDGEGGFMVWGKLLPAQRAREGGWLPIGLAHGVTMTRAVKAGELVRWSDVMIDEGDDTVAIRLRMEEMFGRAPDPARALG
ncbi:MAG: NAD(P)H-dependent oxidoreductase [Alphaproteobacteria bacterium]